MKVFSNSPVVRLRLCLSQEAVETIDAVAELCETSRSDVVEQILWRSRAMQDAARYLQIDRPNTRRLVGRPKGGSIKAAAVRKAADQRSRKAADQ